jgi:serine/threonine protein kinase
MDLKPSNILIFRETGRDGQINNIWKISDFGMSRMKIRRSQERVEKEKDVNSWFIRRAAPDDPSTAPTKNRRAEGTYLPPESVSPEPTMKTHSDVWSLGCVLSVVFMHMEDGSEGVRNYAAQRLKQDDSEGYDRFFVPTRGFKAAKLNPAVRKTHAYLVQRAGSRSLEEGRLVKAALEFLENYVLQIDQRQRQDAKKVESMLERTFKDYMKLSAGPSVAKPPPKPRGERIRQVITRYGPQVRQ